MSAGSRARPAELLLRDLPECVLHAEPGEVEILLVDDRRDPRVDLDHVVADELDVEEVVEGERLDDPGARSPSARGRRGSRSTSRGRRASPRASSGGRAGSGRSSAIPSIVRSLPVASSITSSSVGVVAEQLEEILEAERLGDAGPVRQQLLVPVGRRRRGSGSPASPTRRPASCATSTSGIAELAGGRGDRLAAATRRQRRAAHADPVEQRVGLRLVVRAADRLGRRDEDRDALEARPSPRRGRAGRTRTAAGRRPRSRARQTSSIASAKPGIRPGRHEVEGVGEVAADRALGHVGADDPDLALAVLPQRAHQRGGAGRAAGRDERRSARFREVDPVARELLQPALALGVQHREHRLAHRRRPGRPRSPGG